MGSDLDRLAKGPARDIDAVNAAITNSWKTSPVEGRINRLKTLKRQMYGHAGCDLQQNRVLATTWTTRLGGNLRNDNHPALKLRKYP